MRRSRIALLTALGIDNFGSGLFLPVALLYVTRVVGLPLATAGTVVALGTVAGLAVPPVAGRLVDRIGPWLVVICAELLQALGVAAYLTAHGAMVVAVAAMALGAGLCAAWCGAALAAAAMPAGWRPAGLLAATVLLACGGLLFGARANALAEAAAPAAARGRYLAGFQYAFTVPGVIAPAMVALFSVAVWLPWLLAAIGAGLAVVALRWVAGRLPAGALRADAAGVQQAARSGAPASIQR